MVQLNYSRVLDNRPDRTPDLFSNIYVPAGIFIAGIVAFFVWLGHEQGQGVKNTIAIAELAAVCIVIKFLVIGGLTLHRGAQTGGGSSGVGAAMLKIAALILLLDVTYLWLRVALHVTGSISPDGQGPTEVLIVELFVLIVVGLATPRFIYRLEDMEAATMGGLVTAGNTISNLVLVVAIITILHWMHPTEVAGILPPPIHPPQLTGANQTFNGADFSPTNDAEVAEFIRRGAPFAIDGRGWSRYANTTDHQAKLEKALVDQLYADRALGVYVDRIGVLADPRLMRAGPARIFVELPLHDPDRASCINAAATYRQAKGLLAPLPTGPAMVRYMIVNFR